MLSRQLEPELMDDPQEAVAYDEMDHAAVNAVFVEDLLTAGLPGPDVLDMGTGTARIPIELCRRAADCRVMASDGAVAMLDVARYNVALAALDYRIQLHHGDARQLGFESEMFDAVISNSLIHHVPDPAPVLAEMVRLVRPGGRLFVRDLYRPDSQAELERLVACYADGAPELARAMFRNSLQAALSLTEIQQLVVALGFPADAVTMTSDRHWTWSSVK
jgi:ubiquinone/menaquinone biosynthesis C-methylase UbiE